MKRLIYLFATFAILSSCSTAKDPEPEGPSEPNTKIPITLSTVIDTRVSNNTFETNDKIGVYVVTAGSNGLQVSGNHVDNMGFNYSDGKWTPDEEIYWKDSQTAANFYVYHPYVSTISSIDHFRFTISSDQSTDSKYKSCEFLWGKKENVSPTKEAVGITTKHLMSNLIISLVAGDGYKTEDLADATVKICGLAPTAIIDFTNGAITASDAPIEITPKAEAGYYRALVVPQNIADAALIKIVVGENTYMLTTSINFESGKQHKCTVKVSKVSNGINVGIDGWVTDDVDYGGNAI